MKNKNEAIKKQIQDDVMKKLGAGLANNMKDINEKFKIQKKKEDEIADAQ